jgi:hypothetical protein
MTKRVRKTRHLRKFRGWGMPIAVRRRHPHGVGDFLDHSLEQASEAHGLAFGWATKTTASRA